jgi:hypothetical protein
LIIVRLRRAKRLASVPTPRDVPRRVTKFLKRHARVLELPQAQAFLQRVSWPLKQEQVTDTRAPQGSGGVDFQPKARPSCFTAHRCSTPSACKEPTQACRRCRPQSAGVLSGDRACASSRWASSCDKTHGYKLPTCRGKTHDTQVERGMDMRKTVKRRASLQHVRSSLHLFCHSTFHLSQLSAAVPKHPPKERGPRQLRVASHSLCQLSALELRLLHGKPGSRQLRVTSHRR